MGCFRVYLFLLLLCMVLSTYLNIYDVVANELRDEIDATGVDQIINGQSSNAINATLLVDSKMDMGKGGGGSGGGGGGGGGGAGSGGGGGSGRGKRGRKAHNRRHGSGGGGGGGGGGCWVWGCGGHPPP